jgi:hypothetical protein
MDCRCGLTGCRFWTADSVAIDVECDNYVMDARTAERPRRMTVRRFASHAEAHAADLAYWRTVTPDVRLETVWDLALDFIDIQGQRGDQSGLQRSVCRVERRPQ